MSPDHPLPVLQQHLGTNIGRPERDDNGPMIARLEKDGLGLWFRLEIKWSYGWGYSYKRHPSERLSYPNPNPTLTLTLTETLPLP